MKRQLISWLGSGLIISTFMFPLMALADSNSVTSLSPALAEIQLTPEQQTQVEVLKGKTEAQFKNLLTPKQETQLQNIRTAFQSLELSFKQRQEMRNILQSMRLQVDKILTPEQKYRILGGKKNFS